MGIHEYGWSNNYNKYYEWVTTHWYIPNQVNSRKYWDDVINIKWKEIVNHKNILSFVKKNFEINALKLGATGKTI